MNRRERLNRTLEGRSLPRQLLVFGIIGVASTLAYLAIYAMLRTALPAVAANAIALLVTAIANTAANRRLTFGVRGRADAARHHAAGLVAFGAALAITSGSLWLLGALAPTAGRVTEIAVLVASNVSATLLRFVILRLAVAGASPRQLCPVAAKSGQTQERAERTI